MSDRGRTVDCKQFFDTIGDNYNVIAENCGVDEASLRKFRKGGIVIRRTTFLKICQGLQQHYQVSVPSSGHFQPIAEKN